MASAESFKLLLKSYAERDFERFYNIALQVAAHEARLGHNKISSDIKHIVEKAKAISESKDQNYS